MLVIRDERPPSRNEHNIQDREMAEGKDVWLPNLRPMHLDSYEIDLPDELPQRSA